MAIELVINGKFLGASLEGMPRVGREVTQAMDALLDEPRYADLCVSILTPKGVAAPAYRNIQAQQVGRFKGFLWEQLDFARHVGRRYGLHFTSTAPILKRRGCVVIHDPQFRSTPQSHALKSRVLYELVTPLVARRYADVTTATEAAKKDLARWKVVDRPDMAIVPHAADHMLTFAPDPAALEKFGLTAGDYIFSNSYVHHHKNLRTVLEALKNRPDLARRLVLYGSSTREHYDAAAVPVPEGVRFLGRISNEDLASLIRHARMFLFPSFTEGFGLPPLEAMILGCPTLAADAEAVQEVCGEGALYAKALDPSDWLARIEQLWGDEALRAGLSAAGAEQARRYSWRRSAEMYLQIAMRRYGRGGDHASIG